MQEFFIISNIDTQQYLRSKYINLAGAEVLNDMPGNKMQRSSLVAQEAIEITQECISLSELMEQEICQQ